MNEQKKTIANTVIGVMSQTIILILGIIVPRIVLVHYGSDTNGLTSTIGQIFTYLALLEAGISVSARNAFYKPIHENDKEGISFVASLAKKYYRKVSAIYFLAVICLSLILPVILKTTISYFTVCFYVFFEGLTSVISFFFINTWLTFLRSKGEAYIINIFTLVSKVLCYLVKIILSLLSINIVYIQIGYFCVSLIQVWLYSCYMNKKYRWIDYSLDTGNEKLPDKNANLISEIAWVVFSSTDMIVLSVFISTKISSVYSIYNTVYVAINSLLFSVYSSINYHLGLAYNSPNKGKYIKMHDAFMSVFVGCMGMLMSVCYFLIIPFVRLYTSGVTDINYIYNYLPILFCLVQLLSWSRYVTGNLIGISFRQKPAIKINVLEAVINLSLSIIFVSSMGIEGVLLATVIALPIKVIYCTYVADIILLKRRPWRSILILGSNYLAFGVCVLLHRYINLEIHNYFQLVGYGVLLTCIIGACFALINIGINKDVIKTIGLFRKG